MAERSRDEEQNGFKSILDELPVDRLKGELQEALSVAAERTAEAAGDKISSLTERLTDMAAGGGVAGKALAEGGKAAAGGGSPLLGALKGGVMGAKDKAVEALGGGGSGGSGGKKNPLKATTIIESIDVGVPIEVAYNQWTQFQDFSGFMKKVERVEQKTDEKLDFKAKILWSHRTWEASILEQVPEDKIVWRSKGEKGHVDGSVTFHELAPNLTRVIVVLEYYPQGLFERVGNIWRAQGRRARVELKHFQRHVMTDVILHPDEVDGWRGEIHDGRAQEPAEGEDDAEDYDEDEEPADEYDEDEYEDEGEDEEPEDEYDEDEEPADEDEDEEPADEYDEDEEPADEYDEDEYEDEGEDEEPEDEYDEDEEPADEDEDEEPADEYDEDEYEDEGEDEEPEDEYDEDEEPADEYDEDEYEDEGDEEAPEDEYDEEYDEDEEEPEKRPRRRAS
ncbi:SRPBCC family protein [Kribbella sp. NPDC051936]|uniref:SRPBCC family protein n=1 Tax=Kribbella sp. NPDC051936 TaxID=3154946 RepID=UPI003442F754